MLNYWGDFKYQNLMIRNEKYIYSENQIKEITFAIVLLVRPNVNSFSYESIDSFIKIYPNRAATKYITIPKNSFYLIEDKLRDNKEVKIILQPEKIKKSRNKPQYITKHLTEDYMMLIHDDDLYSPLIIEESLKILKKFQPIALSYKATFIDEESKLYKGRRSKNTKQLKIINPNEMLSRYFLPFKRSVITPTLIMRKSAILSYWNKNPKNMGRHEDVRMNYFLSKRGQYLEWNNPMLYFYRIHKKQDSAIRTEVGRLKLISWIKSLEINFILKTIFLIGAKLQFLVFYKKIEMGPAYLQEFLINLRRDIIKHRVGGNASEKLNTDKIN